MTKNGDPECLLVSGTVFTRSVSHDHVCELFPIDQSLRVGQDMALLKDVVYLGF
jgi:hypothetical protein